MKNKIYSKAICKGVIDKEKRIVHVVASTGSEDRHGDTVNPEGWMLDNYLKNSVILIGHNYSELPVGKAIKTWVENKELHQHIELADTEEGRKVFYLVENGFLKAVSVGFLVKQWGKSTDSYSIMKQELLETSFVAVPAQPEALVQNEVKDSFNFLYKSIDEKGIVKKDVGEVIRLANIADYLNYYIYVFTEQSVRADVITKMTQALALIMECIQDEAVLGQKGVSQSELIEHAMKGVLTGLKVVEEKTVEKIKYVDGVNLSDSAVTLLLEIKRQSEKSSKKTDAVSSLLGGLLNVKTQSKGGDK